MTRSATTGFVIAGCLLAGTALAAQAPALPAAGQPPVLSSTPTPPPGAQSEPAQMSGMPLQVGDLAPGTVAVRVIKRSFQENVVNVKVELRVGDDPAPRTAVTDRDGRAVFQDLHVGRVVRARTIVDGETLESQSFELPTQGGVRMVLVAGVGAVVPPTSVRSVESGAGDAPSGAPVASASGSAPTLPSLPEPATTAAGGTKPPESAGPDPAIVASGILIAAAAGGFWWFRRPRTGSVGSDEQRERLFDELVALEQAHAEGQTGGDYAGRRQALVDAIARLDARSS